MRVFIVALVLALWGCSQGEAAFEAREGQRTLVVGEVSSYEGKLLKKEFYEIFYDMLAEEIQEAKEFRAEYQENFRREVEADRMTLLHMDAIISCGDFNPKEANELLLYYAKGVKQPAPGSNPAALNSRGRRYLDAIGATDLLLFVNVTKVEVISKTLNNYQGTKPATMNLKLHYVVYLVDRHKGLVYKKQQSVSEANGAGLNLSRRVFTLQDLFKMAIKGAAKSIVQDIRKVNL